jgi:hypothetical protein
MKHRFKDGQELTPETIGTQLPGAEINSNTLRITRTGTDHSGRYTCVAKNKAGEDDEDITVFVMSTSTFMLIYGYI